MRRYYPYVIGFAVVGLLMGLGGGERTRAGQPTFTHETPRDKIVIKACVLLLPSAAWENDQPDLMHSLQISQFKPANWEFDNPLAPKVITEEIDHMWDPRWKGPVTFGNFTVNVDNTQGNLFFQKPHEVTMHARDQMMRKYWKPAGTPVTKDMPQYWEVPLTQNTVTELVNFDAVFVNTHRKLHFNPEELSLLQRFVDGGGVLFLEDSHGARIDTDDGQFSTGGIGPTEVDKHLSKVNFFIPVNFIDSWPPKKDRSDGWPTNIPPSGNVFERIPKYPVDRHHPLLDGIYQLTDEEVNSLGDVCWADQLLVNAETLRQMQEVVRSALTPAVPGASNYPAAALVAARYGAGALVVSGLDIISDVSRWLEQDLPAPHPESFGDLKLMYNLLHWKRSWSMERGGPRHTGEATGEVASSLDIKWQFPDANDDPTAGGVASFGSVWGSPVISRGIVYFAANSPGGNVPPRLYAMDTEPEVDRDGDGLSDEDYGLRDVQGNSVASLQDRLQGKSYDAVWAVDLPANPNFITPAVADLTEPTAQQPFQLLIQPTAPVNGVAQISAYYATLQPDITASIRSALNNQNVAPGYRMWGPVTLGGVGATITLPGGALVDLISSPTVHAGWVYLAVRDTNGRGHLLALDAATGTLQWRYPDSSVGEPIDALDFSDPSALPPAVSLPPPLVAILNNTNTRLAYRAVILGTPSGKVYSVGVGWPDSDSRWQTDKQSPYRVQVSRTPVEPGSVSIGSWTEGTDYVVNYENGVITFRRGLSGTQVTVTYKYLDSNNNPQATPDEPFTVPLTCNWADDAYGVLPPNHPAYSYVWAYANAALYSLNDRVALPLSKVNVTPPNPPPGPAWNVHGRIHGQVSVVQADTAELRWSFDPRVLLPQAWETLSLYYRFFSAPGLSQDTLVAVARLSVGPFDLATWGALFGLQPEPSFNLNLVSDPHVNFATALNVPLPVRKDRLWLLKEPLPAPPNNDLEGNQDKIIHPGVYTIDYEGGIVTFVAREAHVVQAKSGQPEDFIGPIYGRQVWVMDDTNTNGKYDQGEPLTVYSLGYPTRWEFIPFLVRTPTFPIDSSQPVRVNGNNLNPSYIDYQKGLLNLSDLSFAPLWGEEVTIEYTDVYGGVFTGNNAVHRIVPPPFGLLSPLLGNAPTSSPIIVGNYIYLGTTGFDFNGDGAVGTQSDPRERGYLLALEVDSANERLIPTFVPNSLPAFPNYVPTRLDFFGSPAVGEDRVFIGGTMDYNPAALTGRGVFYAFGASKYLLAERTRLLEVDNRGNVTWQCTGTRELNWLTEPTDALTEFPDPSQPNYASQLAQFDTVPLAFSQVVKATRLSNDRLLVVDRGNARVIEVDRAGGIGWPLHKVFLGNGIHRYLGLKDFGLEEPTDAFRYWRTEVVPLVDINDADGDGDTGELVLDANGKPVFDPTNTTKVNHTLIVDRRRGEILDVRSWTDANGTPHYDFFDQQTGEYHTEPTRITPEKIYNARTQQWEQYAYAQVQPWQISAAEVRFLTRVDNFQRLRVLNLQQQFVDDPVNFPTVYENVWFANRYLPGLRDFELFTHGPNVYLSLIDRYATNLLANEPAPPNQSDVGQPALRVYQLGGIDVSNNLPFGTANASQRVFIMTPTIYQAELVDFYLGRGLTQAQANDLLVGKVWNPVRARKVANVPLLVVVNRGVTAINQPAPRSEVLVINYELPQAANDGISQIVSLIPDPSESGYSGTYNPTAPVYAERF
ncbi:MAG TPA: hypothetical protein EYP85_09240 [Armatimonadetes bacterium]|nr:hypothetical protein [Armatimonadota bacterium]